MLKLKHIFLVPSYAFIKTHFRKIVQHSCLLTSRFSTEKNLSEHELFGKSTFLSGDNANFMEQQFNVWLKDKKSVNDSTNHYFSDFLYETYRKELSTE
jgi:hypothetical protein